MVKIFVRNFGEWGSSMHEISTFNTNNGKHGVELFDLLVFNRCAIGFSIDGSSMKEIFWDMSGGIK